MPKQFQIIGAILVAVFIFGFGYKSGGNAVRVEYQTALQEQQAIANEMIQANINKVQSTIAENETIKQKLERERRTNAKTTHDLRIKLSTNSLQFTPSSGQGGTDTMSTEGSSPSNARTAPIQLPEQITRSLQELAFDCDTLKDDYTLLYNFTQEIK